MTDARRGRPRSDQADRAILGAAADLLTSVGYERLSVEGIAARAGVAKQTIYRRWPSKAAVVAQAVLAAQSGVAIAPPADTGDLRADLQEWALQYGLWLADPVVSAMIRGLVAAAVDSQTNATRLYDHLADPIRTAILSRLTQEAERGTLRKDADLDALIDAILGTMLYRVLSSLTDDPKPDLGGLVNILVDGVRAQ
ncbi:DNA-binding transcriptional regulator, AcrR family [Parafrankia irregularis]|uniref:DNA-binding transcriptional regulator, AcrR family n=1 Tax=Parafrankia irregularis TaxID=795642 RepID=A0A0S4QVP8_9ACTN|nr:TetR/AcrR family transcriptional regulator [Parafrankia irregularis]CUU58956.1 DNA-binding transcriptional regulator, AcrR family [Parafrankia irregularis]